jgi:hypothetical protein
MNMVEPSIVIWCCHPLPGHAASVIDIARRWCVDPDE